MPKNTLGFESVGLKLMSMSQTLPANKGLLAQSTTGKKKAVGVPGPSGPVTSIEYLVVAGGGGGGGGGQGGRAGSGGGAGGYRTATGLSVTAGVTYTVTVGLGGAGGTAGDAGDGNGLQGSTSTFGSINSSGGGGGAWGKSSTNWSGGPGGSGGGSQNGDGQVGIIGGTGNQGGYSPAEGFSAGGTSGQVGYFGGGGASQASTTTTGGNGATSSISGSSVTYAGGGGGHDASGGSGGGGAGAGYSSNLPGTAGTVNTGGGGGGGGVGGSGTGGAGGSGIVIIRYDSGYNAAASTTGSPLITVAGGYRVYKWTGNGSITFAASTTSYISLTFVSGIQSVNFTNNGTTSVDFYKTGGSGTWDTHAYCATPFTAPCTLEFNKLAAATDNGLSYAMIGWNTDPTTDASYTSLDYASYPFQTNQYQVYNNGSQVFASGTWNTASKFYIVYGTDGTIKHYNGATLLYNVAYGSGQTVYIDSGLYGTDATYAGFTNVRAINQAWNGTAYV